MSCPFFQLKVTGSGASINNIDSWLVIKVWIYFKKAFLKPKISKTNIKKEWFRESKGFWISTVTRNPSIFKAMLSSKTFDLNLLLSLINLFLTYAVWLDEIKFSKTFNLVAKVFEINLVSIFSSDIGLQFSIDFLSLSFF